MLRQAGLLCQKDGQIDAALAFQNQCARFDELFDQIGVRSRAQCNSAPETLEIPLDVAERLAVESEGQDVDPAAE